MATLIHRPEYAGYDFGPEHPFTPKRLEMVLDLLRSLGHEVHPIAAPAATREEILSVHDEAYVAMVEALDQGNPGLEADRFGLGTPDNPIFPGMDLATRWMVGGTIADSTVETPRAELDARGFVRVGLFGSMPAQGPRRVSGLAMSSFSGYIPMASWTVPPSAT